MAPSNLASLAVLQIGVPATIMYATGKDNEKKGYIDAYRKPKTGMWDFLVANLNGGVAPGAQYSMAPMHLPPPLALHVAATHEDREARAYSVAHVFGMTNIQLVGNGRCVCKFCE